MVTSTFVCSNDRTWLCAAFVTRSTPSKFDKSITEQIMAMPPVEFDLPPGTGEDPAADAPSTPRRASSEKVVSTSPFSDMVGTMEEADAKKASEAASSGGAAAPPIEEHGGFLADDLILSNPIRLFDMFHEYVDSIS